MHGLQPCRCLPYHVAWCAMTADGHRLLPQKPLDGASKKSLHIPLDKVRQLPRERRAVGAAKTAVGRFFRAPHPETPINRDFYRRRAWNFHEKRPKLPPFEMAIRGPKRKNGVSCHPAGASCLPFWSKNEKVCRQCIYIEKIAYLCSIIYIPSVFHKHFFRNSFIPCLRKSGIFFIFAPEFLKY